MQIEIFKSPETEDAILGAILLEKQSVFKVSEILKPEHFYLEQNKEIYEACLSLTKKGIVIDYLTVLKECKTKLQPVYLAQLTSKVASAAHIVYHAKILIDLFIKRKLYLTALKTIGELEKNETDILDIINELSSELIQITNNAEKKEAAHISQCVSEIQAQQEHFFNETEFKSFEIGISNIDNKLKIESSDFVILAARPGVGKTGVMLNHALNLAKKGRKIAIFSLEMPALQLTKRIVSNETQINSRNFSGFLENDYDRFNNLKGNVANLPIWIEDDSRLNIHQLRSKLVKLKLKHQIEIAFIDYLQLMSGDTSKTSNREQEISTISRNIKIIAKELDMPIIALSQLSRALESRQDKKPQLSDLRESGSLEQDTDIVLMLYSPTDDNTLPIGYTELLCRKYRNGDIFEEPFIFEKHIQRISEIGISTHRNDIESNNEF